jgi:hypothetical protein
MCQDTVIGRSELGGVISTFAEVEQLAVPYPVLSEKPSSNDATASGTRVTICSGMDGTV